MKRSTILVCMLVILSGCAHKLSDDLTTSFILEQVIIGDENVVDKLAINSILIREDGSCSFPDYRIPYGGTGDLLECECVVNERDSTLHVTTGSSFWVGKYSVKFVEYHDLKRVYLYLESDKMRLIGGEGMFNYTKWVENHD